jgi:hypothetical protein
MLLARIARSNRPRHGLLEAGVEQTLVDVAG